MVSPLCWQGQGPSPQQGPDAQGRMVTWVLGLGHASSFLSAPQEEALALTLMLSCEDGGRQRLRGRGG